MSEQDIPQENQEYEPRLRYLKVLCILTFIGSGLGVFSYGIIGAFYNVFSSTSPSALGEDQQELIRMLLSAGRNFFLLNALLYIASLWGAYLMYHLKKRGFHFYTLSQFFILISPMAFIKGFQIPWMTVILSAMFIFAYAGFLKKMD
ncbi:MAG: hypothetical protein HXX13_05470 [Bacteroidetes bacterium]|nr:hypothetical protein [Bacteroidota bacterium]